MNYMREVDAWLEDRLRLVNGAVENTDEVIAEVKHAIKDKLLESYRNGQQSVGQRKTSGVGTVAGAFSKEALRQVSYTSGKKYSKPRTSRQYAYGKQNR